MNEFMSILEPIGELLAKKNADYGNAYKDLRDKYGPTGFHIFIENKLLRIKQVDNCGYQINETAADTIVDIIGYCTIELKYRLEKQREDKPGEKHTCKCAGKEQAMDIGRIYPSEVRKGV